MTSTRLPGKVLLEVQGRSLLEIQLERLRRCSRVDQIVVATTTNPQDDPLVTLADRLGLASFRGDEMDVLARYAGAARMAGADWIVRVTSDCPLIDPEVVDAVIQLAQDPAKALDYASNTLDRTFPRGLDAECFTARALFEADAEARLPGEREHVTPFLYRHPGRYRIAQYSGEADHSRHRWTVDTPEDFLLVDKLLRALLPVNTEFGWRDALVLMEDHPDWFLLNTAVPQKEVQP